MTKQNLIIEKFKKKYLERLSWNFIIAPSSPKMNLWLYPNGIYELMEYEIKPKAGIVVIELQTLADLKGKEKEYLSAMESFTKEIDQGRSQGKNVSALEKKLKSKETELKSLISKITFDGV